MLLESKAFNHRARRAGRKAFAMVLACTATMVYAQPSDPGPRAGAAGAGGRIGGLTVKEQRFFDVGLDEFTEVNDVQGTLTGDAGLGPTFNLDSCAGCHAHPAVGGTSPALNPQIAVATKAGAVNTVPFFLSLTGPVREVRSVSGGGGVIGIFTIKGRSDAPGCWLAQPNFLAFPPGDLKFRIPTPTFGLGLIEAISDNTIVANEAAVKPFGIGGHANRTGNDGTITRFGWKAQNKSLVIFSGEAYNVEQGVSNEVFPDERQAVEGCRFNVPPEDRTNFEYAQPEKVPSNVIAFSNFMRFLAPPAPVTTTFTTTLGNTVTAASIIAGGPLGAFTKAGCDVCHKPSLPTGNHSTKALANTTANLFSDLLVHDIGTGDGISQGAASGAEFRTAALWGLGQRLFFLHDGSATDLVQAINAHGGEARQVINNFNGTGGNQANKLNATERQNLINFLRSL
jgi:CxxC motif-containing protein (DUF1111 family)